MVAHEKRGSQIGCWNSAIVQKFLTVNHVSHFKKFLQQKGYYICKCSWPNSTENHQLRKRKTSQCASPVLLRILGNLLLGEEGSIAYSLLLQWGFDLVRWFVQEELTKTHFRHLWVLCRYWLGYKDPPTKERRLVEINDYHIEMWLDFLNLNNFDLGTNLLQIFGFARVVDSCFKVNILFSKGLYNLTADISSSPKTKIFAIADEVDNWNEMMQESRISCNEEKEMNKWREKKFLVKRRIKLESVIPSTIYGEGWLPAGDGWVCSQTGWISLLVEHNVCDFSHQK